MPSESKRGDEVWETVEEARSSELDIDRERDEDEATEKRTAGPDDAGEVPPEAGGEDF